MSHFRKAGEKRWIPMSRSGPSHCSILMQMMGSTFRDSPSRLVVKRIAA